MKTISNSDDVIDSRDVIKRIEELRSELDDLIESVKESDDEGDKKQIVATLIDWLGSGDHDEIIEAINAGNNLKYWADSDDARDLFDLEALADEAEDGEWKYGSTLVRESYFTEYCEQLCKDIGDLPDELPSYLVIDWETTAYNLKVDYTEVEYGDVTYLIR